MKASSRLDNIPLYNSRIIDNYVKLIKKKYSYIDVDSLLEYAEMKLYEVADQGHWFTQRQINRFHERLSQLTNNNEIAREAGRFAASPEASGVMRQFFLGMVGPLGAYEMISKGAQNFTRSAKYRSRRLASNKVEIIVEPSSGVVEEQYQCENRTGYLEAISMMFGNKLPKVEHTECLCRGGRCCRYIISWEKAISDTYKKFRNFSAVLLLLAFFFLPFHFSLQTLLAIAPAAAAIVLLLTYLCDMQEKIELRNSLNNL